MKNIEDLNSFWIICAECEGNGKKKRRLSKKIKLQYQLALENFEKNKFETVVPIKPKTHLYVCEKCGGSGLIASEKKPIRINENFPHVAIIGAGIGGVALAAACFHRGIPFTLYERDLSFDERSQGYGLTLQQASKAIEAFGITKLKEGVVSTRHVVHDPEGKIVGEWGMRKWTESDEGRSPNRTNIHIARQALRLELLNQLPKNSVKWGYQLINFKKLESDKIELNFKEGHLIKSEIADLVIGADGIRSIVRDLMMKEERSALKYLDCIVILGICPLKNLENSKNELLDSATVFQTANGNERIYMMPYNSDSIMWQLSFPIPENEAKKLSSLGSVSLKEEAIRRVPWHHPIPEILKATSEDLISGYPAYDRETLNPETMQNFGNVTLLGDAAHPMSPFKGQGANQALLDAIHLARTIYKGCNSRKHWKEDGIRARVLNEFEKEMLQRTSVKVNESAEAAKFLHSENVLHESNQPRRNILKKI